MACGHFLLTLKPLSSIATPLPGQFFMIDTRPHGHALGGSLLKRPFSFMDAKEATLTFLIGIKGAGTAMLARLAKGDLVDAIGPLGQGFPPPAKGSDAVAIIAGGVGIASVAPLLSYYPRASVFYGVATQECLGDWLYGHEGSIYIASDDGSVGRQGTVVSLFREVLDESSPLSGPMTIYACGPHAMLAALAQVLASCEAEAYVSLEERMACGIGSCLGCAVATRDGYRMVCKDGPVFSLRDLAWSHQEEGK